MMRPRNVHNAATTRRRQRPGVLWIHCGRRPRDAIPELASAAVGAEFEEVFSNLHNAWERDRLIVGLVQCMIEVGCKVHGDNRERINAL